MDPILLLALLTFGLILAYLIWNKVSVERQKSGRQTSGIGGPNDPVASTSENMRDPEEIRQSLDAASDDHTPARSSATQRDR